MPSVRPLPERPPPAGGWSYPGLEAADGAQNGAGPMRFPGPRAGRIASRAWTARAEQPRRLRDARWPRGGGGRDRLSRFLRRAKDAEKAARAAPAALRECWASSHPLLRATQAADVPWVDFGQRCAFLVRFLGCAFEAPLLWEGCAIQAPHAARFTRWPRAWRQGSIISCAFPAWPARAALP